MQQCYADYRKFSCGHSHFLGRLQKTDRLVYLKSGSDCYIMRIIAIIALLEHYDLLDSLNDFEFLSAS